MSNKDDTDEGKDGKSLREGRPPRFHFEGKPGEEIKRGSEGFADKSHLLVWTLLCNLLQLCCRVCLYFLMTVLGSLSGALGLHIMQLICH